LIRIEEDLFGRKISPLAAIVFLEIINIIYRKEKIGKEK